MIGNAHDIEEFPQTAIHEPDNARRCVHLLTPLMPRIIAVRRGPVERLNFQPRIISDRSRHAIIAARTGSILTLSVDLIGPPGMTHSERGRDRDHRIVHHWRFELRTIDDDPARLLAVRISGR